MYKSKMIEITTEALAVVYNEHRVSKEQFEGFLKQFENQVKNNGVLADVSNSVCGCEEHDDYTPLERKYGCYNCGRIPNDC